MLALKPFQKSSTFRSRLSTTDLTSSKMMKLFKVLLPMSIHSRYLEMTAITDIMVAHESGYSKDIGKKLVALDGVEQVYYTMSDIDFVVISRVQTRNQLNTLINRIVAIDGVNQTSSKFVMQEFENDSAFSLNITDEA